MISRSGNRMGKDEPKTFSCSNRLEEMRLHWPLLRVTLTATAAFLLAVYGERRGLEDNVPALQILLWGLVGFVYTQFFEYGYHRVLMHKGNGIFASIKKNHLTHHAVFYGENFASRREEDLKHVAGRWFLFPVPFSVHYLVLKPLLASPILICFLAGILVHYLIFEATHWFSHVEDNGFDNLLRRIPVLRAMRNYQIQHHRWHHEIPNAGFNFNPPYLGDAVCRTLVVPPETEPELPQRRFEVSKSFS